ncbi:MAG: EamA family transporter [Verrucomicrobia bacterium]|nr:EamA family transporter [Verrucomicrobiota bacterium]
MPTLLLASLIWACSFGLIKRNLAGVDPAWVTAARLGLAALVFLPFVRPRALGFRSAATLAGIGALQFGVMYVLYLESFQHLRAHEVALFTLTTPLFVTLLADLRARRLRPWALGASLLAIAGAALLVNRAADFAVTLRGVLLVQGANLAFSAGQLAYRDWSRDRPNLPDHEAMGLLYGGGMLPALLLIARQPVPPRLDGGQVLTVAYLGLIASGLGFYLWNAGARRCGTGTLAVMNNAKVPLGVAASLLLFGETAELGPLLLSLLAMTAALLLAERGRPATP